MASIINASSSGSGGIVQTADASGVLQLQSNGTVALTVSGSSVTFASSPTSTGAGGISTNTAFGSGVLGAITTGTENAGVGYQALYSATSGAALSALGRYALRLTTTGTDLSAVGDGALQNNTTGSFSTAVGSQALAANTTASNNTAVGYQAGYTNVLGNRNTFIGYQAGYTSNTATLFDAQNTFVGTFAGYAVTTGTKNTVLGSYNGNQGGLDIRTASNYIVLSDGDGNPRGYFDTYGTWYINGAGNNRYSTQVFNAGNSTPYGSYIQFTGASPNNSSQYFISCADTLTERFKVLANGGVANYSANNTNLSDSREKTNASLAGNYLDKLCSIPVRTYNYIDQNLEEDAGLTLGVFAQDVQAVAPELVMESNWAKEGDEPRMRLSIYQTDLQYALMKAIQELKAELDTAKAEIAALKGNQP